MNTIKSVLEKYSVPLYPECTDINVKKNKYTSVIDYLIFTTFLSGFSIFLWDGGDLPRISMMFTSIFSYIYHINHEKIF